MFKGYIFILSLMFSFTSVFSQEINDTSFSSQAEALALTTFNKLYAAQLPINKGVIFRPIDDKLYSGITYFGEKQVYKGSVLYNGEWYKQLDLVYDIYSDQLIHVKSTGEWIVLFKPEIESFTLENRRFINSSPVDKVESSFYEMILSGKADLLAKYTIKVGVYSVQTLRRNLENRTKLIIHNLDVYHEVDSKNDVLAVLKNKRSEISDFIKKRHFDFKNNLEESVKQIVIYYNQLN